MEVSPQFCVVQQEPEESIFAQEKPELPSMLHRLEGLKVRKESGTPDRSLDEKSNIKFGASVFCLLVSYRLEDS